MQSIVDDTSVPVRAESIEALQINVDSDDSIEQAEKVVREKFGRLDIVCSSPALGTLLPRNGHSDALTHSRAHS